VELSSLKGHGADAKDEAFMSIRSVPGSNLRYYLIAFNKNGSERSDDPDGVMSERIASAIRADPVADVFVMSHGWKGDIPGAIEQYDRWTKAMADCEADLKELRETRANFSPLVVGFHWPSLPWGVEEFGAGAPSFAAPAARGGAPADARRSAGLDGELMRGPSRGHAPRAGSHSRHSDRRDGRRSRRTVDVARDGGGLSSFERGTRPWR
jgi:hypothetical protein